MRGQTSGEPHSSNLPNCLSADLPISRLAEIFGSAGASPSQPLPRIEMLGDFHEVGWSRLKVAHFCGLCNRSPPI
ncbi:MAG: hypothetical protein SLRJCFUN_001983, partial [Candidatus Fervidibacter sp.]